MLMVDRRQVLTADPRDALLSLKQISLDFPAGTSPAQATEIASRFTEATRGISGCGAADQIAQTLGAQIVSRDSLSMRQLPAPLQQTPATPQVAQTTQPVTSENKDISALVRSAPVIPQPAGKTTPSPNAQT